MDDVIQGCRGRHAFRYAVDRQTILKMAINSCLWPNIINLIVNQQAVNTDSKRHVCRRITNRESAQRMRRKRQEDFQNVVQSLSGMQAENAKLKQVQRCATCPTCCSQGKLLLEAMPHLSTCLRPCLCVSIMQTI